MKKSKIILFSVLAAVILFVIIGKSAGIIGKPHLTKVAAELVQLRSITEVITANGKIYPETEVRLSPEVSGEIIEVVVKEGDEVKEGDLLVRIKPDIYQSSLERANASVNSSKSNVANSRARLIQAKARLNQAQKDYERNKKLWEQGAISEASYENAVSAYEVAKADVEALLQSTNSAKYNVNSAEASSKEAREQLKKTTIYAPMSGTISRLNVERGERVVGTAQMAGTELLRIANLDVMEVEVSVNENDIVRVKNGDTAIIEIDAYLGKEFKGVVSEIANSANIDGLGSDQITNFEVKILILKESYADLIPEGKTKYYPFRPGMSASVDIQTNRKKNIITVPIQAVTTRAVKDTTKNRLPKNQKNTDDTDDDEDEERKEVVFVYREGKIEQVDVETGIQDDRYIEIIKGLKDSLEVIIAPYSAISKFLKDDQKVEKVEVDKLFSDND